MQARGSQTAAERLVELSLTRSNTAAPTPKGWRRSPETRRYEVFPDAHPSVQQPQVRRSTGDGMAGDRLEPRRMNERRS